ncbi:hypothetical protein DFH09DRAFT_1324407 [Mycena vulgaris]|nr:hypothetical protein DFH09DRAFT_1324407 [Mycena vulgaris]
MVAVILALRTYAIYQRSRRVLGYMLVVAAGVIGVGVWSVISGNTTSGVNSANLPLSTCISPFSHSEGLSLVVPWAGMAAFDSMVFGLTIYRTFSQHNSKMVELF